MPCPLEVKDNKKVMNGEELALEYPLNMKKETASIIGIRPRIVTE